MSSRKAYKQSKWALAIKGLSVMAGSRAPFHSERVNLSGAWVKRLNNDYIEHSSNTRHGDCYRVGKISDGTSFYAWDGQWYGVHQNTLGESSSSARCNYRDLYPRVRKSINGSLVDEPLPVTLLHSLGELNLLVKGGIVAVLEYRLQQEDWERQHRETFARYQQRLFTWATHPNSQTLWTTQTGRVPSPQTMYKAKLDAIAAAYGAATGHAINPVVIGVDEACDPKPNNRANKKPWQVSRGFRADGRPKKY